MNMRQISFAIEGMSCARCAVQIERALTELDGVYAAQVNYASERATVRYAPRRVTLARMVDAVHRAGFNAPASPNAYARAGHFGLMGMQERAQLFGENEYIKSERGKGTKIVAYVPLKSPANEIGMCTRALLSPSPWVLASLR